MRLLPHSAALYDARICNQGWLMPYVRISIARPRAGQRERLDELQRQIAALIGRQPGCERCYVLYPHDNSGDIARISIWDSEDAAERAASSDAMLALRSELLLAADDDGPEERAFSDAPHD
jgi:quinol monooxygenase YgiN